jgi:peroxiredoxin
MKSAKSIVLSICLAFLVGGCSGTVDTAVVGFTAPDFTLSDKNGKTWTLSELKGKVVFLNFWATWCPPCREEMPSMQRLYEQMPKDKFEMLAVLENDKPERGEAFAKELGLTFPILYDQAKHIWPTYGLTGLPETFIIDGNGRIREKFIGGARWDSPQVIQKLRGYFGE